jgi:hypothetical protein
MGPPAMQKEPAAMVILKILVLVNEAGYKR